MSGTAHRILIVEDDPIVLADLCSTVEAAGFQVCGSAGDGLDAIDRARALQPDAILLDLGLPGLTGTEAARLISREQTVPIVALTGASERAVAVALDAGATHHVAKPFGEAQLVAVLRAALAERTAAHDGAGAAGRMRRDGLTPEQVEAIIGRAPGSGTADRS